jgi:hypothetical protein
MAKGPSEQFVGVARNAFGRVWTVHGGLELSDPQAPQKRSPRSPSCSELAGTPQKVILLAVTGRVSSMFLDVIVNP